MNKTAATELRKYSRMLALASLRLVGPENVDELAQGVYDGLKAEYNDMNKFDRNKLRRFARGYVSRLAKLGIK